MRILYVEDDPKIQAQTSKYLRSQGHHVTEFNNAPEALQFARNEPFDVLLCDYKLDYSPNGLTLAEQVRSLYPARPIVMISHYATVDDLSRGYEIDVDAYLKSPISLPELVRKLYAAVERRQAKFQPETTQVRCGPLFIDISDRTATWHGEPLDLTPAEFVLVAHLASRPNHVFSVTDLCALTKAARTTQEEARNLLKQHFFHLRHKLSQDGKYEQPIQNVRGQGYKWVFWHDEVN